MANNWLEDLVKKAGADVIVPSVRQFAFFLSQILINLKDMHVNNYSRSVLNRVRAR
jgi:hypothetical protein